MEETKGEEREEERAVSFGERESCRDVLKEQDKKKSKKSEEIEAFFFLFVSCPP